jgi:hypothetical protein
MAAAHTDAESGRARDCSRRMAAVDAGQLRPVKNLQYNQR